MLGLLVISKINWISKLQISSVPTTTMYKTTSPP